MVPGYSVFASLVLKLEPMTAPMMPVTTGLQVHSQVLPKERMRNPSPAPSTPPMTAKRMVFFMGLSLAHYYGDALRAEAAAARLRISRSRAW
jgi:hypothetical protein